MDEAEIDALIALMRRHGIAELEHEADGRRVRLKLAGAAAVAVPEDAVAPEPETGPDADLPAAAPSDGTIELRAGMPGHFYRAPAPDAAPYVEVGDSVAEGQTLALLEAMKMLTPVEAEVAAEIVQIHVENAQPVVRGDLLFTLKAAP